MSGHSRWANIKFRKGAADARKGALYSKLSRAILIAARHGGKDPESNFALKSAIAKAREMGLPSDNIQRAIARGSGDVGGSEMEEVSYEGYGPGGAGVIVEGVTENRNRTASDVRHLFSKYGGALGSAGAVSWKFKLTGIIVVPEKMDGRTIAEDEILETAADFGAQDVRADDGVFEVLTPPDQMLRIRAELEKKGYPVKSAEVSLSPTTLVVLHGSAAEQMLELLMELEDHEDVQNVTTDADLPDELFKRQEG